MTDPDRSRHVEVKDGDQSIAAADVTTAAGAEGTVRASLHATPGHIPPGSRASLVDALMETPEVQTSTRLEATVPLGDAESLERLRQRTEDAVTRPAGSTALFDANIPPHAQQAATDEPTDDLSGRAAYPDGVAPGEARAVSRSSSARVPWVSGWSGPSTRLRSAST
jgi:hypothetical protein